MDFPATSIDDLDFDVLRQILQRLDGPTLASASCASSRLRTLAADPRLWESLCLSAWPSLRHIRHLVHRSLFSDAHAFLDCPAKNPNTNRAISKLVSAVDLYHRGDLILSKVVETKTVSPWFLSAPFYVDVLDRKDPSPPPVQHNKEEGESAAAAVSPEELMLSWIIIDPASQRAVNVSRGRPVAVERHWYTEEIQVKFTTVIGGTAAARAMAVVTCGGEGMHVRDVSLVIEGLEGAFMNGKDSLVILQGALEGKRMRRSRKAADAKVAARYMEYERKKEEMKERKRRREGRMDLCCAVLGVSLFLCFLCMVALR